MAGPEPELHGFARMVGSGVRALVWVREKGFFLVRNHLIQNPKCQNYNHINFAIYDFLLLFSWGCWTSLGISDVVPQLLTIWFLVLFCSYVFFLDPKIHVNVTTAQHGLKTLFSKIDFIWGSIEKNNHGEFLWHGGIWGRIPNETYGRLGDLKFHHGWFHWIDLHI